jgi:hypothetical protein
MSADTGRYRDREEVERELPQELRETPTSGAEPSEGEEIWVDAASSQEGTERLSDTREVPVREPRSWWRRMFGS